MTMVIDGTNGVQFPDNSIQTGAIGRNRIINGAMVIDQRNAGASVTNTATSFYTLDRWKFYASQASKFSVQQNAGSVTSPVGFTNYLGVTSLSAYAVLSSDAMAMYQSIEGFNTADLNWGTANAKTVTLSFWVRSSLTGTFGGAFQNSSADRSYPFSFTINAANTWEQKTITVAGDTSGTWIGATSGTGIVVALNIGSGSTYLNTAGAWAAGNYVGATGATPVVGTNGATFYITGVQLEKGSTATSFDYRPYGTELALAQRYYYKLLGEQAIYCDVYAASGSLPTWTGCLPVSMRASPTGTLIGTYAVSNCANVSVNTTSSQTINLQANSVSSTGRTYFHSPTSGGYSVSAEL